MDTSGDKSNQTQTQGKKLDTKQPSVAVHDDRVSDRQAANNDDVQDSGSRGKVQGGQAQVQQTDSTVIQQSQDDQVQPAQPQVKQPLMEEPGVARPAGVKEAEFAGGEVSPTERIPIVEVREPGELPTEVQGWIERVERDDVAEPTTVVHQGQPIVSPAQPQQVSVTLPLDEEEIKKGLQQKIVESIRWLAEWSLRLLKKFGGTEPRKDDKE